MLLKILLIKDTAPSLPGSSSGVSTWNLSIVDLLTHSAGNHLLYPLFPVLCRFFTVSNTPSCFNLPPRSTFLTLSNLETTCILLNTLIRIASIRPLRLACRVHASQQYVKVGITIALTTHTFVPFVSSFLPSTVLPILPIIFDAIPILCFTSLSMLPSLLIIAPRYFITSTCSTF